MSLHEELLAQDPERWEALVDTHLRQADITGFQGDADHRLQTYPALVAALARAREDLSVENGVPSGDLRQTEIHRYIAYGLLVGLRVIADAAELSEMPYPNPSE